MTAIASAGGLKRLWHIPDVTAPDVTIEFRVKDEGGVAKLKLQSSLLIQAILPSPLDVDCEQDTPATGARLATDLQMTYLPEEILFEFPLGSVYSIDLEEDKTMYFGVAGGRYGVRFGSKWSCKPVYDAVMANWEEAKQKAEKAVKNNVEKEQGKGKGEGEEEDDAALDVPSVASTYDTPSTTASEQSYAQACQERLQHTVGLRVGSVPRQRRMQMLLERGPSALRVETEYGMLSSAANLKSWV